MRKDLSTLQLKNFFFYTFGIVPLSYYNVVGDGITDNRIQIQQAIYDAINNDCKYIFVEIGDFYYSGHLLRQDEIIFIGNSVQSNISGISIRQFPDLWNESQGVANSINPIGSIILFAGQNIPDNYLECNGETKNIADYSSLLQVLATSEQLENDSLTTFTLPNISSGDDSLKYIIRAR